MPQGRLGLYPGRTKKFPFQWRQGSSASSPPIDCTGATCAVIYSSFPQGAEPTITEVDVTIGSYVLTFDGSLTKNARSDTSYRITIALTFASDPGYSPDPVTVEIVTI